LGPNSFKLVTGQGSGTVRPFKSVSVLEGLKAKIGADKITEVPFKQPMEYLTNSVYAGKLNMEVFNSRRNRDKNKPALLSEEVDKIDFKWENKKPTMGITEKDKVFVVWTGDIVADKDGEYQFVLYGKDVNLRAFINDKMEWDSLRSAEGSFVMSLKKGKAVSLKIEMEQRKKKASIFFKAGWGPLKGMIPDDKIAAVKSADIAVVCVGFNIITGEGEGSDHAYELPGRQDDLIREVAKLNKKTLVILNCGGAVATEKWINEVPGFMHSYYTGQEAGTAITDVIFGDVNPSGKLPFSYEKRWEDCAAYGNYPMDDRDESVKNIVYKEGIFVGYRWFDKKKIEPLFPFGHGLSYTTYEYSNLKIDKKGDVVEVKIDIKNTGKRAGAEVVQLYVGQPKCSVERPVRELKGFSKVTLNPGENKTVTMVLKKDAFSFFDPVKKQWVVEAGDFIIELGASSKDVRQKQEIKYGS